MGLGDPSRTAMWLVSVLTGVLGTSRNGRGDDSAVRKRDSSVIERDVALAAQPFLAG